MASLLDIIVARRNPQAAGLLGVQANPAAARLLSGTQGLLSGVEPEAGGVQSGLLATGPTRPVNASLPQLRAGAALATPGGAAPAGGLPAGELIPREEVERARQANAAAIAQAIAAVRPDGNVPREAEPFVRETVDEGMGRRGAMPGQRGRGFLARLFAGDKVPGLTENQNRALLRNSLVTAGLSLLAQPAGVPFGQALATGILAARLQTAETAGQLLDEQQTAQRVQERLSTLTNPEMSELERWTELRRRAVVDGDLETAKVAGDVIDELRELPAGEAERKFQVVNGVPVFVDEQAGRIFDTQGNEIPADALQPQPEAGGGVTLSPGQVRFERDPETGQLRPVASVAEPVGTGAGEPTRAEQQQAQVASELRREVGNIRSILGDDPETEEIEGAERFGVTGTFGRFARLLPAELEPSDLKQLRAASGNILSLIVRQRSGAQATDAEVKRLESFAIPKAGDDPETIRTKLNRLENMVRDFEQFGADVAIPDRLLGRESEDDEDERRRPGTGRLRARLGG